MKGVVMLAIIHQHQIPGKAQSRLRKPPGLFEVEVIVMEEWAEKHGQSVAAKFATGLGLHWANAGTPDEERFRTYTGPINYPVTALVPTGMRQEWNEYGPLENQEARENRMVTNVQAEMEKYETGLFIVGLAHTHSLFDKLQSAGFTVTAFSWL